MTELRVPKEAMNLIIEAARLTSQSMSKNITTIFNDKEFPYENDMVRCYTPVLVLAHLIANSCYAIAHMQTTDEKVRNTPESIFECLSEISFAILNKLKENMKPIGEIQ